MKNLMVLIAVLVMGASAGAETQEPWEQELVSYETSLNNMSGFFVAVNMARQATTTVSACGVSVAVVAASVVADTLPATGVVSEILANMTDMDYETQDYESLLSLEALLEIGRGTSGGLAVASAETVELFFLYLSGNLDAGAYEGTEKVYASSIATLNALFANKSLCMMSMSKTIMAAKELKDRYLALVGKGPMTPSKGTIQQLMH